MKSDTQLHWTVLRTKVGRGKRKTTVRVAAEGLEKFFLMIRGHMEDNLALVAV